ncbi:winged helix-turn-helix domain-containing protein [Cellulomonas dongxiuzhuiae]|uniref:Winged helix-turn-helix domain-containing protein n=1 Tax=Cellulomonas dongxiuzhuiae TaxID=2819979 RepID=A0ABX8GJ44_9CELL|nr:winged helix-turn-helix domain-containing protein [Cellulomonas dongxiuzhuiae]MBO3094931.1 winged helix-turn-helix transcriptional regulator [Cellulomonas dongxiuzhuiae]QWC15955.1 winged helix-turn-helix domain-containing protein [Cellulomonas dongxiuzhuiae]
MTGPTPTTELRTSDPAVLRALAHPLRVEILDLLDDLREATASQVAERTGQTVANCSFHLRSLAKAGYVERAEPRGREKPWRAARRSRRLEPDPADTTSVDDVVPVATLVIQREAARAVDHFADPRATDPARVRTTVLTTQRLWATPDELEDLAARLAALTDAFAGRDEDPSLRPQGAVPARFFGVLHPEIGGEAAASGAGATTPS